MGYCQRKMRDTRPNNTDELRAAVKAAWPSKHLSSADGLHATSLWSSNLCKRSTNQVLGAEMNILFWMLISLYYHSFFQIGLMQYSNIVNHNHQDSNKTALKYFSCVINLINLKMGKKELISFIHPYILYYIFLSLSCTCTLWVHGYDTSTLCDSLYFSVSSSFRSEAVLLQYKWSHPLNYASYLAEHWTWNPQLCYADCFLWSYRLLHLFNPCSSSPLHERICGPFVPQSRDRHLHCHNL